MGIGTSIFLIAVGAILKYAVTANVSGVDLEVVGVILMIAGVIGLLISLLWMTIWADRAAGEAYDASGAAGEVVGLVREFFAGPPTLRSYASTSPSW